ncbi:hypothetical protein [Streptomyces rubiginosohelvolus]|uniref:hypothetical protein n=1 Tax=Streptomyces rubiginosohelvolus TaxID=67362 RepID=UPI0036A55323
MLFRNAARTHGRHPARTGLRAGVLAVIVAAALVSCTQASSGGGPDADVARTVDSVGNADRAEREAGEAAEAGEAEPTATRSPGPALVRDAFATLQATLNETCTPGAGDCAYFLGRVTRELTELDESMRADTKGPGHFKKPLADMKALFDELGDDRSEPHLEKHFSEIVGTRDRINTWMQDHPDDYR